MRWFAREPRPNPDIILTMNDVESLLVIAAYADPDRFSSEGAVAMIARASTLPRTGPITVRVIYG